MRILGLDPGLENVGWCFIDQKDNTIKGVAIGTIKTKSTTPIGTRLFQIFDALDKLVSEYKPSVAAVETSFVSQYPQSTLKLGMARGTCLAALSKSTLPIYEYAPLTIKKAISGKGKSSKDTVKKMVSIFLPALTISTHHANDAAAAALCHSHHQQSKHPASRTLP